MNNLIFFFSSLGVFNGILLSLYLLLFTKKKSLSKYLLGALIFALSIRIGKSVLLYFDPTLPKIYLQIGLSACLFIGPLLFLYLKAVLGQVKNMPASWKWSLIGLLVIIVGVGSIKPYQTDPVFWNEYVVNHIYSVWFIGVCAAGYILLPQLWRSYTSSVGLNALEKWLFIVYVANVIIASAFFMAIFGNSMAYYITGPLVFSFFLYLLVYGYYNNQWFEISEKLPVEKYADKKIDQDEVDRLLKLLEELMANEKMFTQSNLKLSDVADQLNISSHQLSQLLNDNLGQGFKPFLNSYRIQAACELLGTNNQLSLEGIGYEVGFRSKSTFFTTFKKIKQMTPAQYQSVFIS